jgi:hypothetical protein
MAHHKRKRPKNRRAGRTFLDKTWKVNGASPSWKYRPSELRRMGGRTKRLRRTDE